MVNAAAAANPAQVSSSKVRSDATTKTSLKRNSSPNSDVMTKAEAVANPARVSSSKARSAAATKTSAKQRSPSKSDAKLQALQESNNQLSEIQKQLTKSNPDVLKQERKRFTDLNKKLEVSFGTISKETQEKTLTIKELGIIRRKNPKEVKELSDIVAQMSYDDLQMEEDVQMEDERKKLTTEKNTEMKELENDKLQIEKEVKEPNVIVAE
eukprot:228486_1